MDVRKVAALAHLEITDEEVERLRGRLPDSHGATFVPADRPDIRVEADQAVIETCLAPWIARLAEDTA